MGDYRNDIINLALNLVFVAVKPIKDFDPIPRKFLVGRIISGNQLGNPLLSKDDFPDAF